MAQFALKMLSALGEPAALIGYVAGGLMLPRLWMALLAAVAWAALMQAWDAGLARAQQAAPDLELAVARLAVALAVAAAAFALQLAWRNFRPPPARR